MSHVFDCTRGAQHQDAAQGKQRPNPLHTILGRNYRVRELHSRDIRSLVRLETPGIRVTDDRRAGEQIVRGAVRCRLRSHVHGRRRHVPDPCHDAVSGWSDRAQELDTVTGRRLRQHSRDRSHRAVRSTRTAPAICLTPTAHVRRRFDAAETAGSESHRCTLRRPETSTCQSPVCPALPDTA